MRMVRRLGGEHDCDLAQGKGRGDKAREEGRMWNTVQGWERCESGTGRWGGCSWRVGEGRPLRAVFWPVCQPSGQGGHAASLDARARGGGARSNMVSLRLTLSRTARSEAVRDLHEATEEQPSCGVSPNRPRPPLLAPEAGIVGPASIAQRREESSSRARAFISDDSLSSERHRLGQWHCSNRATC
jgi:hypothetical protein